MDILVLGGTRFIGKHLTAKLLAKGYNVTIATRGITQDTFERRVERIVVDRADAESLKSALLGKTYDVVYDSLAYCSNDVKNLLGSMDCKKYIEISSASVYTNLQSNTKEDDFDPYTKPLVWCGRNDASYDEIKRQAECAIVQAYPQILSAMVRFPFVIGEDDYTKRLYFYVDHIVSSKPMFIDNYEQQMAFVRSDEAGNFLAFFAENNFCGGINGASEGTISIKDIADYVEAKTGKTAILIDNGEEAPYNGVEGYSINVDKAKVLGFQFTPLKNWIYKLIDKYIETTFVSELGK